MNAYPNLTATERDLLKRVVELYIGTGEPVSSRMIKRRFGLTESTAHIRNVLHALEERGYLFKPYVSAGRVPSDAGYRLYVNDITGIGPLSGDLVEEIRAKIGQEYRDIREVLLRTSQLLNEVTSYMGFMIGIASAVDVVERLRIVQLEGNVGLVVLILSPPRERTMIIRFPKRYRPQIIDRAVQIINERISGFPLVEAPARLDNFMRDGVGVEWDIARAVRDETEYLFERSCDLRYSFTGTDGALDAPELRDPKILRNLVRIMGERSLMLRIVRRRLNHEMSVTIGRENELEELEDFSIVTHRFSTGDFSGLLGVLGPTRMSYQLVLALLSRTAEELYRQAP